MYHGGLQPPNSFTVVLKACQHQQHAALCRLSVDSRHKRQVRLQHTIHRENGHTAVGTLRGRCPSRTWHVNTYQVNCRNLLAQLLCKARNPCTGQHTPLLTTVRCSRADTTAWNNVNRQRRCSRSSSVWTRRHSPSLIQATTPTPATSSASHTVRALNGGPGQTHPLATKPTT
jgi:hypothetical protein